ncbi:MAG: hypothetical protein EBR40_10260 [Proteobacteria bacterium]|nr:hypothetical protein [Pseudomonadota bacterium]
MQGYNPSVNDNSGQYIAAGINSAASSIAGGMTKRGEQGMMDRKTLDMNLGKLDQYHQAGLMDADTYGKFIGMPVSRQSGALAGFEATVVNPWIKQQQYQAYADANQQLKGAGVGAVNGPLDIQ